MKLKKAILATSLAISTMAASVFALNANAVITMAEVTYYSDPSMSEEVGGAFRSCQLKWIFWGQTTAYKTVVHEPCM